MDDTRRASDVLPAAGLPGPGGGRGGAFHPPDGPGGAPAVPPSSFKLKVAQLNLHRSPDSGSDLLNLSKDIDLVQEPP